jgi:hypothetical protein
MTTGSVGDCEEKFLPPICFSHSGSRGSLGHIAKSRLAWYTEWDPVSKIQENKTKQATTTS